MMGKTMMGALLVPKAGGAMPEEDEGDDLDIPAQDLIDAVKTGDVEGVKSALRAAVASCMDAESAGDYEAEEKA